MLPPADRPWRFARTTVGAGAIRCRGRSDDTPPASSARFASAFPCASPAVAASRSHPAAADPTARRPANTHPTGADGAGADRRGGHARPRSPAPVPCDLQGTAPPVWAAGRLPRTPRSSGTRLPAALLAVLATRFVAQKHWGAARFDLTYPLIFIQLNQGDTPSRPGR